MTSVVNRISRVFLRVIKIFGIVFGAILGLILILVLVINSIGVRSDLVEGVDSKKIEQVKINMSLEEVIGILGRPYKMSFSRGLHKIGCKNPKPFEMEINGQTEIKNTLYKIHRDTNYCCEGNRDDLHRDKPLTLTYSRPVEFSKYFPMLWVHFDSNYKVTNVFAKEYEGLLGFEDPCIYYDGIIDKEKFERCFK